MDQAARSAQQTLAISRETRQQERDKLFAEADGLWTLGQAAEAIAGVEQVLAIDRELLGDDDIKVAGTRDILTRMHLECEDFDEAHRVRSEAVSCFEELHGADDWRTTDARLALAHLERLIDLDARQRALAHQASEKNKQSVVLYAEGKHAEALAASEQSVATLTELLGDDDCDVLACSANLAEAYRATGQFAKAEPQFSQVIAKSRQILGATHPGLARYLTSCGELCRLTGDSARAEAMHAEALRIFRKSLGDKDPDLGVALNNLGLLHLDAGRPRQAEPLFTQAMEILAGTDGNHHPSYAIAVNNLAAACQAMGDLDRALKLFQEALALYRPLGEAHPLFITCLGNLGRVHHDRKELPLAEHFLKQAAELRQRAVGESHPDYANDLQNLAGLCQEMGNQARAIELCERALAIYRETVGEDHPGRRLATNNLAELQKKLSTDVPTRTTKDSALQTAHRAERSVFRFTRQRAESGRRRREVAGAAGRSSNSGRRVRNSGRSAPGTRSTPGRVGPGWIRRVSSDPGDRTPQRRET